jgi:hypothetical protein
MSSAMIGLGVAAAGAGAKALGSGLRARGAISEEEEERLKELERMEAINMLGGDYGAALGRHMTPVQGAMREARETMAQDVSAQDIRGGTYFRGQQAMTEAAGKERASAEQMAQMELRQMEEMRRRELAVLREKKRMKDDAWKIALQELGGGVAAAAPAYVQADYAQKEQDALKLLAKKATDEQIATGRNALAIYEQQRELERRRRLEE